MSSRSRSPAPRPAPANLASWVRVGLRNAWATKVFDLRCLEVDPRRWPQGCLNTSGFRPSLSGGSPGRCPPESLENKAKGFDVRILEIGLVFGPGVLVQQNVSAFDLLEIGPSRRPEEGLDHGFDVRTLEVAPVLPPPGDALTTKGVDL